MTCKAVTSNLSFSAVIANTSHSTFKIIAAATMASAPDFSKEDLIGTAAEFAPGAWVLGHAHYPGGMTKNMVLNNRCFVFKLKLHESLGGVAAGDDALFVWGLGNEGAIKGVKDLEEKTGLKAVALMCNGGGHHIYLKLWCEREQTFVHTMAIASSVYPNSFSCLIPNFVFSRSPW